MTPIDPVERKMETFLVAWECDKCGRHMTGYVAVAQSAERGVCGAEGYARGIGYPARLRKAGNIIPYICQGMMQVIHDERPPKLNVIVMERDPPLTEAEKMETARGAYARKPSVR